MSSLVKSSIDITGDHEYWMVYNVGTYFLFSVHRVFVRKSTDLTVPLLAFRGCNTALETFAFHGSRKMCIIPKWRDHYFVQNLVQCGVNFWRADTPPLKRTCFEETDDVGLTDASGELPDLIQGEIARLHPRFIVGLDPSHHPGSKVVQLLCRLGKHPLDLSCYVIGFRLKLTCSLTVDLNSHMVNEGW